MYLFDKIVNDIKSNSPDGGFVEKDTKTGMWFQVDREKARKKVGFGASLN